MIFPIDRVYLQVASIRSLDSSLLTCPMNTSETSGVRVCRNNGTACGEINAITLIMLH